MTKQILTIVFSHGKEGSPNGRKAKLLKDCTFSKGLEFIAIDYSDCNSLDERVNKLFGKVNKLGTNIILLGSSMGGYLSTIIASKKPVKGLYLLAPALFMDGYPIHEYNPKTKHIQVRHGWKDDVIPYQNSIKFCQEHGAKLELVDDNHRMSETMKDLQSSFSAFLQEVIGE